MRCTVRGVEAFTKKRSGSEGGSSAYISRYIHVAIYMVVYTSRFMYDECT